MYINYKNTCLEIFVIYLYRSQLTNQSYFKKDWFDWLLYFQYFVLLSDKSTASKLYIETTLNFFSISYRYVSPVGCKRIDDQSRNSESREIFDARWWWNVRNEMRNEVWERNERERKSIPRQGLNPIMLRWFVTHWYNV